MESYLIIAAIIFGGSLVQGLAGFGFALVAMPLLALMLPMKELVPLVALSGTFLTLVLFLYLRKSFSLKKILPLLAGAVVGIPAGVFLLTRVDEKFIKLLLAGILLIYSLLSLSGRLRPRDLSHRWGYLAGFFSGLLGGAINSNGPPVIVYSSLQKWSPDEVKVTLQSFFMASGIMIVTSHGISGIITMKVIRLWGMAIPVILAGIYVGMEFYSRIDRDLFRKTVLVLLLSLAVMLLLQV